KKKAPKKTDKPLKKTSTPKAIAAKKNITKKTSSLTITFQIRFHTEFGQELFVIGNHPLLGDNDVRKAVPLSYFNEDFWYTTLE
ncbi:carbohydrate-binding module family 20 domain-containing protein, partial [Escherichia coli]|uniref:carbohydrate-binding module family 20 domain-containing protein n=1 Tax=Escherichia coli TaxID=562 RepID=UPI0039E02F27